MKEIKDLKTGDSVWYQGKEYQFGCFNVTGKVVLVENNKFVTSIPPDSPELSLTYPRPELKRGQPIWVRDRDKDTWVMTAFSSWAREFDGCVVDTLNSYDYFRDVWESWNCWKQYKLPTREELKSVGFDPDFWETSD